MKDDVKGQVASGAAKGTSMVLALVISSVIYGIAIIATTFVEGFSATGETAGVQYAAPIAILLITILSLLTKDRIFPVTIVLWSVFLHVVWLLYLS